MTQPPLRLFVDQPLAQGQELILSPDQTHYLVKVMRRQVGAPVLLFNGRDGEWAGEIAGAAKKKSAVLVGEQKRVQAQTPDLMLLFAPVKRAPLDQIAQKATELGVAALQPVLTARTIVTRVKEDRLRANAIEAAEQSERLGVPEVRAPEKLEALIRDWPEKNPGRLILFCDEAGEEEGARWGGAKGRAGPVLDVLQAYREGAGEKKCPRPPWAILTGPEGGFSPEERALLRAQEFVIPASLGPRILRADTAAFAAITLWQAMLGDLGDDFTSS